MLGSDATLLECQSFDEVFAALRKGSANVAVVPLENSIVGKIAAVTELIKASDIVLGERFSLKIDHVLAGVPGATLDDIRMVSSHPVALKQCQRFLVSRKEWRVFSGGDTASCVRRIAEGRSFQYAAIGSRRAVKIYGAQILAESVADSEDNTTSFCLIKNKL